MSNRFRNYLLDAYVHHGDYLPKKIRKDFAIQIDDQDDNDNIQEFCNIFITVGKNNSFTIELTGAIAVTPRIADIAEIYDGYADQEEGKVLLKLHPRKIEALTDLASRIRETAYLGPQIRNPAWLKISARTISSLYRFIRIVKEFQALKATGF
jgi:hypothetical protein